MFYVKFDDEKAGKTSINTSSNSFAKENHVVPIEPVLTKIKVRPGKAFSPKIQRIQLPICVKGNLEMENYEYIPTLNALKFDLVDTKLEESRSLLLYRKSKSNVSVCRSIAVCY